MVEWTEGVCGDGAAIIRNGEMMPIEKVIAHLNAADAALVRIVRHWNEFGEMMVFNNAVNKDDYGFDEVIQAAAKLVEES